MTTIPAGTEVATLAGGCFWCLEAVFDGLKGVASVESGYMGGRAPNPTYEQVAAATPAMPKSCVSPTIRRRCRSRTCWKYSS